MTLLLYAVLICLLGFFIHRTFHFKKNSILAYAIACIFVSIFYYISPLTFESLDDKFLTFDYWEDAMGAMIIQDVVITAFFYTSLFYILFSFIFRRIEFNPINFKTFLAIILSVAVFIFVFFHESSEFNNFSLSPSFWWLY